MSDAIDENVIAVANDLSLILKGLPPKCPQADDACRLAAIEFLNLSMISSRVLLDERGTVFEYYKRKATLAGQPGSGDAFLKRLYESAYDERRVERIDLPPPDFNLPEPFLASGFDYDDRIYVALVFHSEDDSKVVNAVDSDYKEHAQAIQQIGVQVMELCDHCLK